MIAAAKAATQFHGAASRHRQGAAATCAAVVAMLASAPAARAQTPPAHAWVPGGAFIQLGESRDGTRMATLGLQWQSGWRHGWWGGQLGYSTEALLGHWRAPGPRGGHETYTHLALVPMLRNRADGGRSRWFLEGGIGVSLTDNVYRGAHKQFSTTFNFVDVIGVGYSFGAAREHELGLRVVHISNADVKKPNPGMDSLQLRYARMF